MNTATKVTVTRVIDGDTVDVVTSSRIFRKPQTKRLRLYGIDAPESAQKGGTQSTKYLRKIIGSGKKVWMETNGTDKYGRTVAIIYHRNATRQNSYNHMMVRAGQARAYMGSAQDRPLFMQAEQQARQQHLGIWQQNNNTAPWDWRKDQKRKQKTRAKFKLILIAIAAITILTFIAMPICTRMAA